VEVAVLAVGRGPLCDGERDFEGAGFVGDAVEESGWDCCPGCRYAGAGAASDLDMLGCPRLC